MSVCPPWPRPACPPNYPPGQNVCPPPPPTCEGGLVGAGGGGAAPGATPTATTSTTLPRAAPLRGKIGTVDKPIASDRTQIYGPFEAGFTAAQTQQFFGCNPGVAIQGGIDTLTAEQMVQYQCNIPSTTTVLDACGGHAIPYHYHERMTCLYTSDPITGHSTRIATMNDGRGLYGKYVGVNTLPTDLDACGGRTGITPDSNLLAVYYYMVQDRAPFTVGCFGPVSSVAACKELYPTCSDGGEIEITTREGTRKYDPDCPCYDVSSSSAPSSSISSPPSVTTPASATPPPATVAILSATEKAAAPKVVSKWTLDRELTTTEQISTRSGYAAAAGVPVENVEMSKDDRRKSKVSYSVTMYVQDTAAAH
jgi:hypothetical protein